MKTLLVKCFKESSFPLLPEVTIKNEHNFVYVRRVPREGLFASKGVKAGDVILSVNGISFKDADSNTVFSTLSELTGDIEILFDIAPQKTPAFKPKESKRMPNEKDKKDKSDISDLADCKNLYDSKNPTFQDHKLEECPECDQNFTDVDSLSEHYEITHSTGLSLDDSSDVILDDDIEDLVDVESESVVKPQSNLDKKVLNSVENYNSDQILRLKDELNKMRDICFKERLEAEKFKRKYEQEQVYSEKYKLELDQETDLNEKIKEKDEVIKRIRHQKNKEISKNLSLIEDLKSTQKLQDELNLKLKDLESHSVVLLKEKTSKCQELENKLKDLKIEFDKVSFEKENLLQSIEREKMHSEQNSHDLQTVSKLQLENEIMQKKINSHESEYHKLLRENDAQRQHISKLGQQIETFKNSFEVIQSKISEQSKTIASMKENLEEKTKQVKLLESELVAAKDRGNKYKKNACILGDTLSRKEDVIEKLEKEKKANVQDESKKDQLERKVETLQETILHKSGRITKLEEEIELLKSNDRSVSVSDDKKLILSLKNKLTELELDNKELSDKLANLVNVEPRTGPLVELEDARKRQEQLEALCKSLEKEKEEVSEKMKEHEELQSRCTELYEKKEKYKNDCSELEQKVKLLEKSLSAMADFYSSRKGGDEENKEVPEKEEAYCRTSTLSFKERDIQRGYFKKERKHFSTKSRIGSRWDSGQLRNDRQNFSRSDKKYYDHARLYNRERLKSPDYYSEGRSHTEGENKRKRWSSRSENHLRNDSKRKNDKCFDNVENTYDSIRLYSEANRAEVDQFDLSTDDDMPSTSKVNSTSRKQMRSY